MTFVSASLNAGAVPCHQFQDERLRNVEPWSRQCSLSPPLGTKVHQVQLPSRNNDRLHHVGARGTNAAEHLAHLPPPRRSAHNGQSHSPATMKLLRRLGLTYVATEELTIRRLRHGRGFRYVAADGTPLRAARSRSGSPRSRPRFYDWGRGFRFDGGDAHGLSERRNGGI